ncbi:restriction endonuclease subunit S [Paenibacillus sp. LX16]|uniref:restriction endonuclease subunit S n=1 Tax=unclassified Paenibacillus TaxID=185978 RepID=UPI002E2C006E|nr:restriction endonuclease subunit S [Paenibacillus sp. LX16]
MEKIKAEKEILIKEKKIKKFKPLPEITEDETPYELPQGWGWVRWGELIFGIDAGWSPKCHDYSATYPEWGVLKISAVTWGRFNPNENKYLPEMKKEKEKLEVKAGDFLISRANTAELVARSVIVEETPERLLLSDKILRLLFSDEVIPAYINLVNLSPSARKYYSGIATGTSDSMKNVSQEQIKGLLIPLPPLNEQKRIVEKVDQFMTLFDELEKSVEQSRQDSELLMQSILQGAFGVTGTKDNIVKFPIVNSDSLEDWEIAARSDGEIDFETKAKIKNRVTELLGKSQQ